MGKDAPPELKNQFRQAASFACIQILHKEHFAHHPMTSSRSCAEQTSATLTKAET